MNRIHISEHNSKMNGIRAFAITPIVSCPHATEECKKYCYATKGRFMYPSVVKTMADNLEATKESDFVERMNSLLSPNERFFRIHTAGDFYSKEYFEKWATVAWNNKGITFLAYTRSKSMFNWDRPENLILIFSADKAQEIPELPKGSRRAFVVEYYHHTKRHLDVITEDLGVKGLTVVCNSSDCLNCRYCWEGSFNVAFPQQYKKHDIPKEEQ